MVSLIDVTIDRAELRAAARGDAAQAAAPGRAHAGAGPAPAHGLGDLAARSAARAVHGQGAPARCPARRRVERHASWPELDGDRLVALIEDAFDRPLAPGFRDRPFAAAYVADDYRGAAVVEATALRAVPVQVRGHHGRAGRGRRPRSVAGAGRGLAARCTGAAAPTTRSPPWYRDQCDGLHRFALAGTAWMALWRGLAPAEIPAAIDHCMTTPPDFTG